MEGLYKVLIVDDEAFAREGLSTLMEWEKFGFVLLGEAENGPQAIRMIAEHQPDLVITDISMPEMSGIELIAYVREHMSYQPNFVILSGYGTFEYAKEAMRLNVDNYILKPVIRSEVQEKLIEVKAGMDRQRQEQRVREQTNKKLQLLSRSYLMQLLDGTAGENTYKLELILNLRGKSRQMFVIKIVTESGEEHIRERLMLSMERIGIVPEPYEMIFMAPNFAVIFLDYTGEQLEKRLSEALLEFTDAVYIVMKLGCVENSKDILRVWKQVSQIMDYCFYRGNKSRIFREEDMESVRLMNSRYCRDILKGPEKDEEDDREGVIAYCSRLRSHNIEPEQIRVLILARLMEAKTEVGESEMDELQHRIPWLLFEELKDIWVKLVREEKADSSAEDISIQIEEYIRNHFRENITIQDISRELCYNEFYLGKLIKKKTGMTFRQYLNKVRLDYAEKLLEGSYGSVIEIAHNSGFSNPDYFCKKFRERNGLTPTEFRKR